MTKIVTHSTIGPLAWSAELALDMPAMDQTHREFVELLAEVRTSSDAELLSHWQSLIDHTVEHFKREDDWMKATGFSTENCHSMQHDVIIQVMREGTNRGAKGELQVVRDMAAELAIWFPEHAQSKDAALAEHLKALGFDPETGIIPDPQAVPGELIESCHGLTTQSAEKTTEAVS